MIALDGADGRMLDRRSDDGSMLNLAALRTRGRAKRLSAPHGLTDDALWASFQYAADVGEHGRYSTWLRLANGRRGLAHLDEVDRDAFWDGLSRRGMRVAVLDVPKCREPRPINGIHLADWLVHGRYFAEPQSYPASLAAEIVEQFGPAPPSRCGYDHPELADEEVREIVGDLRRGVGQKRAAALHYLQSEPWDLFIVGFKELHCSSHKFWDFADASHPDHDPGRISRLGDPVTTIFQDVDAAVGDLVAAAGPAAEVVLFSTTDFMPNGSLDHLMPGLVVALNKRLAGKGAIPCEPMPGWRCQLLAYSDNAGALRIVRDARIGGGATPDAGRSEVADELEAIFFELVDAESGRRVVSAVTRPSAEFTGARATSLPDLLIHYEPNVSPCALSSPRLGVIGAPSPNLRPGNHTAGGFVIAAGDRLCVTLDAVESMADLGPEAESVLGFPGAEPRGGRTTAMGRH